MSVTVEGEGEGGGGGGGGGETRDEREARRRAAWLDARSRDARRVALGEDVRGWSWEEAEELAQRLNWLGVGSCSCPWGWRSLGKLYGRGLGKGWVRLRTARGCRWHDERERG